MEFSEQSCEWRGVNGHGAGPVSFCALSWMVETGGWHQRNGVCGRTRVSAQVKRKVLEFIKDFGGCTIENNVAAGKYG